MLRTAGCIPALGTQTQTWLLSLPLLVSRPHSHSHSGEREEKFLGWFPGKKKNMSLGDKQFIPLLIDLQEVQTNSSC